MGACIVMVPQTGIDPAFFCVRGRRLSQLSSGAWSSSQVSRLAIRVYQTRPVTCWVDEVEVLNRRSRGWISVVADPPLASNWLGLYVFFCSALEPVTGFEPAG